MKRNLRDHGLKVADDPGAACEAEGGPLLIYVKSMGGQASCAATKPRLDHEKCWPLVRPEVR
jgi:hypothetical protein